MKSAGNHAHNFYLRARRILPSGMVSTLKKSRWASGFARFLQPGKDGRVYELEDPLNGFRMSMPGPNIYSMVWGEYEPGVCNVMREIVQPGWTTADIGAHIGYHSLLLAHLVGDEGKVFSFEPLPQNIRFLEDNVVLNGLQGVVSIEPAAVMEKSGTGTLYQAPDSFQACVREADTGEAEGFEVAALSIDDYLRDTDWPHLHFIKMDIEGAESNAIASMKECIERFKPVVLLEAHGENARKGIEQLLSAGYIAMAIGEDGRLVPRVLEDIKLGHEHWLLKHG